MKGKRWIAVMLTGAMTFAAAGTGAAQEQAAEVPAASTDTVVSKEIAEVHEDMPEKTAVEEGASETVVTQEDILEITVAEDDTGDTADSQEAAEGILPETEMTEEYDTEEILEEYPGVSPDGETEPEIQTETEGGAGELSDPEEGFSIGQGTDSFEEFEADGVFVEAIEEASYAAPVFDTVEENVWQVGTVMFSFSEGVMTVSGTGATPDFAGKEYQDSPWYGIRSSIEKIVVEPGITRIGSRNFAECATSELVLSEGLVSLGEAAFFDNRSLKSAMIPDTVTVIGEGVFGDCSQLSQVTLGEGVREIAAYAFQNTPIRSLTIPASVESLDSLACFGCASFTEYAVDAANPQYTSVNGVLYSRDKTVLCQYPIGKTDTSYMILNGVTQIEKSAFLRAAYLQGIEIPATVKEIGEWAFSNCSLLERMVIPDSVETIGYGILQGCAGMKEAVVGSGLKELPYLTFGECSSLEKVVLKEGLHTIYNRVFYKCGNLKQVNLPEGLERIMAAAFMYCGSLETLVLPDSIKEVEAGAFLSCDNLTVTYPDHLEDAGDGSYREVARLTVSGQYRYDAAYEVLDIVNRERTNAGLAALTMDQELLEGAMQRAAETSIDFSHTRPSGASCFSISTKASGENIAGGSSTAQRVMQQWMNSPGHKANILSPESRSVGIGCFIHDSRYYWVQLFSTETSVQPPVPANKNVKAEVLLAVNTYSKELDMYTGLNEILKVGENVQAIVRVDNPGWRYMRAKLDADSFTWSSSNPAVASVDVNGNVTVKSAGDAVITASAGRNGSFSVSKTVQCRYALGKASASPIPAVVYSGMEHRPEIELYYQGRRLIRDVDYRLSYGENVSAGRASVKADGIGDFTGRFNGEFTIEPLDITGKAAVTLSDWNFGNEDEYDFLKREVTVTYQGKKLSRENGDYWLAGWSYHNERPMITEFTVRFDGNYKGSQTVVNPGQIGESGTGDAGAGGPGSDDAGTDGSGDSTQNGRKTFRIKVKKSVVTYDGKAKKPTITVYAGDTKVNPAYYKVTYSDNVKPGTASIAVKGKGAYKKYRGEAAFTICPKTPEAPGVSSVKKGRLSVKWKRDLQCKGYEIQISRSRKFTKGLKTVKAGKKTGSRTVNGLAGGKKYYVRMRSYVKTENGKLYSQWSKEKKIKVK